MYRLLLVGIATLFGIAIIPGIARAAEPITLEAVLQRVAGPTPQIAPPVQIAGAGTSAILQTIDSSAPQPGTPPQTTLTQQLTLEISSAPARRGRIASARAGAAQIGASFALSRRSAARSTLAAFFAIASDQGLRENALANVALARRALDAAAARVRIGAAPRLDEERARSSVRTAEADLAAAEAAVDADRMALADLIATPVEFVALPANRALPPPDTLRARTLAGDPSVAAAAAELRSAEAAVLIIRGVFAPSVSVGAGVSATRAGVERSAGPVLSLALNVPLGSPIARSERALADLRVISARASLAQTEREAVQNVLRLRSFAASASARIGPLSDALQRALSVANATVAGYRLGAVSSADVLTAENQVTAARAALRAAQLQASQATAGVLLEIGDLPS